MENGSNELGLLSRDNEILTSLNTKLERENRCVRVIKLRCVKVFAHFAHFDLIIMITSTPFETCQFVCSHKQHECISVLS